MTGRYDKGWLKRQTLTKTIVYRGIVRVVVGEGFEPS